MIYYFSLSLFTRYFTSPFVGIYMAPAARALRGHHLSGEVRTMDLQIHPYFFDLTRTWRGLPGRGISSVPGPPPRQHRHIRQSTTFTHTVIQHRHEMMKMMMEWPNDIGDPWGPKFSGIRPKTEGKSPEKTPVREFVPTGIRTRARSVRGANASPTPPRWTKKLSQLP